MTLRSFCFLCATLALATAAFAVPVGHWRFEGAEARRLGAFHVAAAADEVTARPRVVHVELQ